MAGPNRRVMHTVWAYTGTLLVMLIMQAHRGNYVWQQSVKSASFQGGNGASSVPPAPYGSEPKPYEQAALNPGQVPYSYPPSTLVSPQSTGQPIPQV